jgi:hypothetical protein
MPNPYPHSGRHPTTPAGGEVERYDPIHYCSMGGTMTGEMEPNPDGDWVRHEDYEKLKHEFDLLVDYYSTPTPEEMDVMNPELDQS